MYRRTKLPPITTPLYQNKPTEQNTREISSDKDVTPTQLPTEDTSIKVRKKLNKQEKEITDLKLQIETITLSESINKLKYENMQK